MNIIDGTRNIEVRSCVTLKRLNPINRQMEKKYSRSGVIFSSVDLTQDLRFSKSYESIKGSDIMSLEWKMKQYEKRKISRGLTHQTLIFYSFRFNNVQTLSMFHLNTHMILHHTHRQNIPLLNNGNMNLKTNFINLM